MRVSIVAAILLTGAAAQAEPVDGKAARKLVFAPDKVEVVLVSQPFLSEQDAAILNQVGAQQPYYTAIAASPSEGLMSNSLLAAANFHDVDTARAAAIAGCNARKDAKSDDCVIVAEVRPKGWEARPMQLSNEATTALRKEYRKGSGPKALAISVASGDWGIGKGEGAADAALADCAAKSEGADCTVVIQDN